MLHYDLPKGIDQSLGIWSSNLAGESPATLFVWRKMQELSAFADESGDSANQSKHYLLTIVFHDQSDAINSAIKAYEQSLIDAGLPDVPFHLSPLLNGHKDYENHGIDTRKQLLARFLAFARKLPIQYKVFRYKKRELSSGEIVVKMKRDLINFLFEQIEAIQRYDTVKIYYDDGQRPVTHILEDAFNYALARNTAIFKDGNPSIYRLSQVADAICGLELVSTKYEFNDQTKTDNIFFQDKSNFSKNFMKPIRSKRL
jgi:hypothetical protein